ncbi:MAG: GGDEF domain-containing protein [Steroidobacteraceae bacterium]
MPALQLFADNMLGDNLAVRLRDPADRATLRVRQQHKGGLIIDVDLMGHRVWRDGHCVLAYVCHDTSLRTRYESRLLEKQQHLDHLAHHDQLTGLPNRLFLAANLPEALKEAAQRGRALAVLFLDLDRFKHINDSSGHETGDQLLKAVAERLRATLRGADIVIRMGGDEFVVILKSVRGAEDVNEAALRITEALSQSDCDQWPGIDYHGQHRRQPVSQGRRGHGRTAAAFRHRHVPGQGTGPQQLPGFLPHLWTGDSSNASPSKRI